MFNKRRKIDFVSNTPSKNNINDEIDWEQCFICECVTNEKLQCSYNALTANPKQSYVELARLIKEFQSLEKLPVPLRIEKLESGLDLGDALYKNKAKFHKSCKLKFNNKNLNAVKHNKSL